MAALPVDEAKEEASQAQAADVVMGEAGEEAAASGTATPVPTPAAGGGAGGGAGGKKKKKGKR